MNGGNDYSYTYLTTHGTEVASIIGAVGNNQKGMSGVCQNVSIKSYMVASGIRENGQAYAYVEDISSAVLRAYMDDIDILNISWEVDTSDDTDSANLNMVCDMFEGLIVIAAGNDHSEIVASNTEVYSPCYTLDNVIVVGAIDTTGTICDFSNYSTTYVDLMAFGKNVNTCSNTQSYSNSSDGTSLASPFVAGVAALLLSYDNTLTTAQLKQYILEGVHTTSALEDYCSTGGYLDAYGSFLAMLENQPKSVNLQVQQIEPTEQIGTIAIYCFEINHFSPYARLTEIVIPPDVKGNMVRVEIEFSSNTIDVTLHVKAASLPADTPLMDFHFITYYSIVYGKAYVGVTSGQHINLDGDFVTQNVPYYTVMTGDVTGDDAVNATDMLRVQQHAAGSITLTDSQSTAGDVDGDFDTTRTDAEKIGNYISGDILSFY